MKIVDKLMRSMRGHAGADTVQSFYGAIARTTPEGGPHFSETKRDYDKVRLNTKRYMMF